LDLVKGQILRDIITHSLLWVIRDWDFESSTLSSSIRLYDTISEIKF